MHKLSSLSKRSGKVAAIALLLWTCVVPLSSCSAGKTFDQYERFCILQSKETPDNERWAHYLYNQLNHRTDLPSIITERNAPGELTMMVRISFDPSLGNTYKIEFVADELILSAGNKDVMLWLCYQFISKLAEQDSRFSGSDLPPAAIEIETTTGEWPFEFRGISSPSNVGEDMLAITASHNVDSDWALWGHNINKVIKAIAEDQPSMVKEDIYAEVNGRRDSTQYCFSSQSLYKILEYYIADQWGEGSNDDYGRFTIMPMDNRKVCTCSKCLAAGNTADNATPAVTSLTERLAKRFPHQRFFTSAYASTRKRPDHQLPTNVGVLVSAMDIPMVYDFKSSTDFADFDANLKAWLKLTPEVYIWEYARNFDDYLTPYPCLSILQQRLQYYKELGVKGVFINGSEDKYSTFDDMQTAALQAMLTNPQLDLKQFVTTYFHRFYPKTGDILASYYTDLEEQVKNQNIELPYYGGIDEELRYIDADAFQTFCTTLDSKAKTTDREERFKLNKMLTGLSFTPLEIMRLRDNPVQIEKAAERLEILSGYEAFPDMAESKEALGSLETYIEQWNDDSQNAPKEDLLKAQSIKAIAGISDQEAAQLTDGRLGFYSDYHTCWVISRKEWQLQLPAQTQAKTLRLSLLVAPAWYLWEPEQIEVYQSGNLLSRWNTQSTPSDKRVCQRNFVDIDISNANPGIPLTIKMKPVNKERAAIACDEIITM
ncbi:MAG: DUF4838 domain-containing protein [Bacteroidaceae bacterium]|nr:DUF4838 domain-containing protein [Bacteroidaceae bacterium]